MSSPVVRKMGDQRSRKRSKAPFGKDVIIQLDSIVTKAERMSCLITYAVTHPKEKIKV